MSTSDSPVAGNKYPYARVAHSPGHLSTGVWRRGSLASSIEEEGADISPRTDSACRTPIMGRPRVLFVIDQLCEAGGAERVLLKTVEGLMRANCDVRVVTFKSDPEIELFKRFPCPVDVFTLDCTYNYNALRVAWKIRQLIRSHKIQIVHTFHETSDIWGGFVARISGCRAIVSSRRDMGILRRRKHDIAYKVSGLYEDRVLAVSEQVRNYCIKADRLSPNKVIALYNGIDVTAVDSHPASGFDRGAFGILESAPIITTVGHVRRIKGIDTLIQAAARVCLEFPEAVFLVVGDSSENDHFEQLKQLTSQLGLTANIKFLGAQDNVFSILKNSDIFLLPSRSEGFSNALLEAMACELPCVVTNVGGNSEAVAHGVNGYVVERENPEAMARSVTDLLRSPEKARRLGRMGRIIVEQRFSLETMIHKLVAVYEGLLDDARN